MRFEAEVASEGLDGVDHADTQAGGLSRLRLHGRPAIHLLRMLRHGHRAGNGAA